MVSSLVGNVPISMLFLLILMLDQPNLLAAVKDANDDTAGRRTEARVVSPRLGQKFKVPRDMSQNNMKYIHVGRTRKLDHENHETCDSDPPLCDDGSCGDCQTARNKFGCSCPRCQCAVCELDDFCCSIEWDESCVKIAESECGCGPEQLTVTVSPRPTVSTSPTVAPTISPRPTSSSFPTFGDCGDVVSTCKQQGQCGTCASERPGERGCSCPACECEVCSEDSFCCRVSWDQVCVQRAGSLCECFPETNQPSVQPSEEPSIEPSVQPSEEPSIAPSVQPSEEPSIAPSVQPSEEPSVAPSVQPSEEPSIEPSVQPSEEPSIEPSVQPSEEPSTEPSVQPSEEPSIAPSVQPSEEPSTEPSVLPSEEPSIAPSVQPSEEPSVEPSEQPSEEPSVEPSVQPSEEPSVEPSVQPSEEPSIAPSVEPSEEPSIAPSVQPSEEPSIEPSVQPSEEPSIEPSVQPSEEPSFAPSVQPSEEPSIAPSVQPSEEPSVAPSVQPTEGPTVQPSEQDIEEERVAEVCLSEPSCENNYCGDCRTARIGESGCSCPQCQCSVCDIDDLCCSLEWDTECVKIAEVACDCIPEPEAPSASPRPTSTPTMTAPPTVSSHPTFGECEDASTCAEQDQCGTCVSERLDETGCSCHACECLVCSIDRFCCRHAWDEVCVARAGFLCNCIPESPSVQESEEPTVQPSAQESEEPTVQPSEQESEEPTAEPSEQESEEPTVQPSAQTSEEPSVEPSEQGIGEQRVPEVCLSEPTCQNNSCGDCRTARNQLGCSCPQCECTVCEIDDFCCSQEWDESCVELANRDCSCGPPVPVTPTVSPRPTVALTISPRPTTSSFPTFGDCGDASACETQGQCGTCSSERLDEKGCSCSACECEVCSADPFCCRVAWDQVCVDKASSLCNCSP